MEENEEQTKETSEDAEKPAETETSEEAEKPAETETPAEEPAAE